MTRPLYWFLACLLASGLYYGAPTIAGWVA